MTTPWMWARTLLLGIGLAGGTTTLAAPTPPPPGDSAGRALTIYNQNFAVVRETVPLDLTAGVNHVTFNDITYHLEPDSVVLRDPAGKRALQVLEQNYRADPISQDLLLSLYEGQTIDFQVQHGDHTDIVRGKIVRSGYVPHSSGTDFNYGQQYYNQQQSFGGYSGSGQPLIEVDGKLQFTLPGLPLFPTLTDDSILKPTLDWTLRADRAGPLNAELSYVTGGMSWKAAYNVVMPEQGDDLDLVGWVTMDNQSGKTFENARIKLMAGDVSKIQPQNQGGGGFGGGRGGYVPAAPGVTEKAFDEYHLYTLARPTTLRDRETKQVEFTHATGVHSTLLYVYDGAQYDPEQITNDNYYRNQPSYGAQSNPKVFLMREIVNTESNGLGIPLPKGDVRFYRRDTDGQLEFIGENEIDHTPKDETLRIYTGNAFDLTGERTHQTNFLTNSYIKTVGTTSVTTQVTDESFTIQVHNHKTTPAPVHIVEHLYRGVNWTITDNSAPYVKKDARTIEYRVVVPANGATTVTYTVHYTTGAGAGVTP